MRGRPIKSEIRQNIIDILFYLKKGYGYEISKIYMHLFPKCTKEVIYYHLRKGVDLSEFEVVNIVSEKGQFSWGNTATKKYYRLGTEAMPRPNKRVEEYLKRNLHKDH